MRKVLPIKVKLVPEGATKVFSGVLFDVYQWQQKMFDDSYQTFEMLKRPDTVKVICIKGDKIILIDETDPDGFNYYGLPGGRHDVESEDELQAAQREVLEEIGMEFNSWKLLDAFQPSDQVEQIVYIYLAYDLGHASSQKLDSGEDIKVKELTLEEFKRALDHPKARYLPKDIVNKANSLEDLLNLPEFKGE